MKRKLITVVSIVLFLTLLSACGNNNNSPSGNTADNATTTQEHKEVETLFYHLSSSKGVLKINSDGTGKERVLGIDNEFAGKRYYRISVKNGWIYYYDENYNICRTKTNETQSVKISNDPVYDYKVEGNWIYFIGNDDWHLYKMKTDGSEKKKLHDKEIRQIEIDGNYVYFTEEEDMKLYRVSTDGNNPEYLNVSYVHFFEVDGNHVIYQSTYEHLYIMDVNTLKSKKICDTSNNCDIKGQIYIYEDGEDNLHVADIYSNNDTIIASEASQARIMNDKIYYFTLKEKDNPQELIYYTINYDGSGKMQFPLVPVDTIDFGLYVNICD